MSAVELQQLRGDTGGARDTLNRVKEEKTKDVCSSALVLIQDSKEIM